MKITVAITSASPSPSEAYLEPSLTPKAFAYYT